MKNKEKLTAAGHVNDQTNGLNTADKKPIPHEEACKMAEDMGMIAAYDGILIEI